MKKLNEVLKEEIDNEILPIGIGKHRDGYRVSRKFRGKHLSFGTRKRLNDAIALNDNVQLLMDAARNNVDEYINENRVLKSELTKAKKEIEHREHWAVVLNDELEHLEKENATCLNEVDSLNVQVVDHQREIARLKKRNLWQRILNK